MNSRRRLRRADHLVFRRVGRPARIAEDRRQLVALLQHAREHVEVLRVAAQSIEPPQLLARLVALGVGDERNVVGIIGRDRDFAVAVGGVRRLVVLGQPFQIGGVDEQRAHVVFDVLAELLADLEQLFAQLLDARARRFVLVDTRAPQIAQRLGDVIARRLLLLDEIDRRQRVVDPAVERQLRRQRVDLLLALIGGVAHLLVGMRVAADAGARRRVAERAHRAVVGLERRDRIARHRHSVERRDSLAGTRHVGATSSDE